MARLSSFQILGLRVETDSGDHLGKITSLDIDDTTHCIVCYHIRSVKAIPGLFSQELLVAPDQILSISKEKMVVVDAAVRKPQVVSATPSAA